MSINEVKILKTMNFFLLISITHKKMLKMKEKNEKTTLNKQLSLKSAKVPLEKPVIQRLFQLNTKVK